MCVFYTPSLLATPYTPPGQVIGLKQNSNGKSGVCLGTLDHHESTKYRGAELGALGDGA